MPSPIRYRIQQLGRKEIDALPRFMVGPQWSWKEQNIALMSNYATWLGTRKGLGTGCGSPRVKEK